MTFTRPETLYLLLCLPVLWGLFLLGGRKRANILAAFAERPLHRAVFPENAAARRKVKAGLLLLAFFFAVFALSGPLLGYRWEKSTHKGVDIVIALDCSRSMLAKDVAPSRLDRAKQEISDLLGLLEGDRAGLVLFGGTAFLQCPLTVDYPAFQVFLRFAGSGMMPVGGSDIPAAVDAALTGFDPESSAEKAIVLFTDGQATGPDPAGAAGRAGEKGVRIFCIGVGGFSDVPVPDENGGLLKDRKGNIVLSRLHEDALQRLAQATGGVYLRSSASGSQMKTLYLDYIRKMNGATLESGRRRTHIDRFQWLLGAAVLLLALDLIYPAMKKSGAMPVAVLLVFFLAAPALAGVDESMEKGLAAYEKKDYKTALKHFQDAHTLFPSRPEIAYNAGVAAYRLGDYESAARMFESALEAKNLKIQRDAGYNLGNARFRKEDLKGAAEAYEQVLKIDPRDAMARENLALVRRLLEKRPQSNNGGEQSGASETGPENADKSPGKEEGEQGQDSGNREADSRSGGQGGQENASGQPGDRREGSGIRQPETPQAGETAGSPEQPANGEDGQQASGGRREAERADGNGSGSPGGPVRGRLDGMLNRLEDKPGRAMVPAYRKQEVEKDW